MASFGLIQDQNSRVSIGGKTNGSKAVRKGGISGRKPLGDLSNSVKPTSTQATKKLNSNIISFTEKEPAASKVTSGLSKKKSISNASDKKVQVGGRKALSDISNSGKPHLLETSKKNLKATAKLGIVVEEAIHHDTVAEECFLHNHQECIKAQKRAVDVDEFLKIVGLDMDNGFSCHLSSPWPSPAVITKMKPENPLKSLELEDMHEHLLIEEDSLSSSHKLELSPPCRTPKSLDHDFSCNVDDCISFKLMETPASMKL